MLVRWEEEREGWVVRRRGEQREMWLWLGTDTKLRKKDVVRVGREFYLVEGTSCYLESSTVVRKY